MDTGRLARLAPLAGVLFTVLMVVAVGVGGDTPAVDAPAAEILDHYEDDGPLFISVLALLLAGVALLFFAGALRSHFAAVGPDWLATVVFGGAIVFAAGLGMFMSSQIALIDAADNQQEASLQALNVIDNTNFGAAAIGMGVMYLASAWHVLAARSLPVWIGWVALLLGLLAVAGPLGFIAFLAFPIWVLIVSIALFRRIAARPAMG